MSSVTGTSFNWLPQPSMYQEMQNWSAKRSQGISEATSASDAFNTAISNVAANVTSGQGPDRLKALSGGVFTLRTP